MTLETLQSYADFTQTALSVLAIIVGVYWFYRRRESGLRANVSQTVSFQAMTKGQVYVAVNLTLKNTGNVPIRPPSAGPDSISGVVIEELLPYLNKNVETQLAAPEYELLPLGQRAFPKGVVVQPKEQQTILFEFIIQQTTKSIKVYSYIDSQSRTRWHRLRDRLRIFGIKKIVGWNATTTHEVLI